MRKNNSDELHTLISACQIQRYSTKESLEFLKSRGFEISERTFFKYKNNIKNDIGTKGKFAIDTLVLKHLQSIETLELIDKELWHEYLETKDQFLKIKILNSIRDNQIYHSKFQESIPNIIDKQMESMKKLPLRNRLNSDKYLEDKKVEIQRELEEGPIMIDTTRSYVQSLEKILENMEAG